MTSRFPFSICQNFKYRHLFRFNPIINPLMPLSQKRLFSRKVDYHQNNHGQKIDSNLEIKKKRFGLSWLSISALFLGSLIFWPVALPIFAIGFATVITTGTMIFIGGWLVLVFAGVLVMGLALVIPAMKVYFDFKRIDAKQRLIADWHVVAEPTSPWFGHRWAKPRRVEFEWIHQYTKIDGDGNVIVSNRSFFDGDNFVSKKIRNVQAHFQNLHERVGKVVGKEARNRGINSSQKVWLERCWLYFFKFSLPFDLDLI